MDLIRDYLEYHSGNECPRVYHLWACLSMIATISGKRCYYIQGGADGYEQLIYDTSLYVGLIGPQGSRKSFAKDAVRDLIMELFPDLPISEDVETREGIVKALSEDECLRVFTNENAEVVEYRPMYLVIDELVNFLSVNPGGMISFLVNIFGRNKYGHRTKNKGTHRIVNPNVNILACGTTEFIIDQLRSRILSGGLARRMVFVCDSGDYTRQGDPKVPLGGKQLYDRIKDHLRKIPSIVGPYTWESDQAFREYVAWYNGMRVPNDPLMAGFYRSYHVQILKLTMLHDLASYEPKRLLTIPHFELARATVECLEPGMESLFLSAGRNELAAPQQRLLELITRCGGMVTERQLLRQDKDLSPEELRSVLRHLTDSGRLVKTNDKGLIVYMLEERFKKGVANGEITTTSSPPRG